MNVYEKPHKRFNLYYIFKDDYESEKLSSESLEKAKEKIFSKIFKKYKTKPKPNSS